MPIPDFKIKNAELTDVEQIENLVNNAYRGQYSKKGWTTEADLLGGIRIDEEKVKELISDPNSKIFIYLASSDRVEGCVNVVAQKNTLYLGMLTVNPILQDTGIGKKLLTYVEGYAQENKFKTIEMTVISKRSELISWYERRGFFLTGEKRPFPVDDPRFGIPKTDLEFVVMKKKLSQ